MFKSARKFPIAAHIAGPAIVLCSLPGLASAQDATWLLAPGTPDFNTSTNWNPVAPPAGPTGTATFDASSATTISFSQATSVGTFFFNAGALSYTFTPPPPSPPPPTPPTPPRPPPIPPHPTPHPLPPPIPPPSPPPHFFSPLPPPPPPFSHQLPPPPLFLPNFPISPHPPRHPPTLTPAPPYPSTTLTITGGGIEGATAANAPTFNSGFPGIDFEAGTAGPAVFNNHR